MTAPLSLATPLPLTLSSVLKHRVTLVEAASGVDLDDAVTRGGAIRGPICGHRKTLEVFRPTRQAVRLEPGLGQVGNLGVGPVGQPAGQEDFVVR